MVVNGDNVFSVLNNLRECNQIKTDKVMFQTVEVIYDSDRITTVITKLQNRMKVTIVSEFGVWSSSSNSANGRNTRWEDTWCVSSAELARFLQVGKQVPDQCRIESLVRVSYLVLFCPISPPSSPTETHAHTVAVWLLYLHSLNR